MKLIETVRAELNRNPTYTLHFRNVKHDHRLPFIGRIASAQLRTVNVLIHKPSLKEPETFRERYRLYYYAVRLLLERVSWFCRDHRVATDPGDGSAEVIFSNRSGMSYVELCNYLRLLQSRTGVNDVRIDWQSINLGQVRAIGHDRMMGLQIADAVASAFYFGVESSRHGFTEPRYAQMLLPVVYHRGRHFGHGLKFWPREAETLLNTQANLQWVRQTYT